MPTQCNIEPMFNPATGTLPLDQLTAGMTGELVRDQVVHPSVLLDGVVRAVNDDARVNTKRAADIH